MAASSQSTGTAKSGKRSGSARADYNLRPAVAAGVASAPDWICWEQDERHRFTHITESFLQEVSSDTDHHLGKTLWEIGAIPHGGDGTWKRYLTALDARKPFNDFVCKYTSPTGRLIYFSISGRPRFDGGGRFLGYRGVSKDVTDRVRLEQRFTIEHDVANILAQSSSIADATPRILRSIGETLGWTCGARWELDVYHQTLTCTDTWRATAGSIDDFLEETRRLPAQQPGDSGMIRRACARGAPIWVRDLADSKTFLRAAKARKAGLRTGVAFPILVDGRVVGAFEFYSRDAQRPDSELLDGLMLIGGQIGQMLRHKRAEEELLRFRAAMDMSGDSIYLVDRTTMRFIDVNVTACQRMGYTREELLQLGPHDVLFAAKEDIERSYDEVIAGGGAGIRIESFGRRKDGTRTVIEIHRRGMCVAGHWIMISVARDISARKRSEHETQRLARMYTALSATNEAIMRARSPTELFQQICDAGVHGGQLLSTMVMMREPGTGAVALAAASGVVTQTLRAIRIPIDGPEPAQRSLVREATRTHKTCVSNDYLNDERTRAWHDNAREVGIASGACVPLIRKGVPCGVLLFYEAETDAFSEEIVGLLERLARNVEFALDNFERADERQSAEEALRASEEKYRDILENVNDGYFEVDLAGNFTFFNDALCRAHRRRADEMMGLNYREYMDADAAERVEQVYREVYRTGKPARLTEWAFYRKDGALGVFESSVHLKRDRQGKPIGFRGVSRDVTERHLAQEALRESEERFRSLIELSTDWYWECNAEFRFTRIETKDQDHDATSRFDADLGKRPWEVAIEAEGGWEAQRVILSAHRPFHDLITVRTLPDGTRRYAAITGEPMFDSAGEFKGYRGVGRDITTQKVAEEKIQYLATHDSLTDLPNRVMLNQLLNVAIQSAKRYARGIAVLFIDLDRFKVINDTLGHEIGDELLKEIGARLKQILRGSDVVARLGGDEFVVLIQEVSGAAQVATVARKILAAVTQPVALMGQECRMTASIGISMYPTDANDEASLMKHADMAMYLAKDEGKNNFQFYSREVREQSIERLRLEANLRRALERDEFTLSYQPKLDLRTGAINGVEALLRWHNAELGAVSPTEFIPLAEETGLIAPISKWVLRRACAQNIAWQRAGLRPVRVTVNLSARQFTAEEALLSDIAKILEETGMAPQYLELEITEGMMIRNLERSRRLLNAIKKLGVRLAIDDFGTGYSSLGQLKNFPIDTLKIDRSFVCDIPHDTEDSAIVRAIIVMGKTLGMTVVAEGVESAEQMQFLRAHECDEIQGYYFSKPIDPHRFADLLRAHRATPGNADAPITDYKHPHARQSPT